MDANELLFWMSARRSGSWLQFRSALEDLGLDDRDGDDTNQRGLPTQHRFRLNLERLAHVEFEGSETENAWRVAPPVLAVTRLAGKSTGILCGARSTALLSRLREASGPAGWEEAQFPECPSVIRLFADDERSLARVAETAQVYFQPEATLNLLSLLHPVDRIALGTSADMPFGRDVNVEEFRVEKKRCRWEQVSHTEAKRAGDGLFRCTRWQSPEHFLRIGGRTFTTAGQVGKYFMLWKLKRRVIRYDAQKRRLQMPSICRPPALVDRALTLCSGVPQNFDEQTFSLNYSDVEPAVAGLVAEVLRQPLI